MPSNMVEVHQRLHIYANESKHMNSVYVSWLIGEEEREREKERGVVNRKAERGEKKTERREGERR